MRMGLMGYAHSLPSTTFFNKRANEYDLGGNSIAV
jgi:hypothetical protein